METVQMIALTLTNLATYSQALALDIEGQDHPDPAQWAQLHTFLAGAVSLGHHLQIMLDKQG
ncbi:MAG: hypothetical protein NHG36_00905 [Chromatiaceae bacterium]|jgi:hypothetical protein|nr:hypothetical protein [Candidatus Thioaporhodococcus sediminis]